MKKHYIYDEINKNDNFLITVVAVTSRFPSLIYSYHWEYEFARIIRANVRANNSRDCETTLKVGQKQSTNVINESKIKFPTATINT